jgi:LCP family protein required for cell wall assembly
MSKQFHLHSTPPPDRQRSDSQRLAIGVTAAYAAVVLTLALLFGGRLHDWAQQRIVQSSILAELAELTSPAAIAELPPAGAQSQPVQGDQTETAAAGGPSNQPVAEQPAAELEPVVNILLLGTDERPDEYSPPRTDTIILLSFNPNTGAIGMLSLPRDLWVPLPGINVTTKINTAFMLGELRNYPGGGAQLIKDTVSSFVGRPVDYYVRVNFDGFREIIDLIGGVTVEVPYTIHDEEYPTPDYGVETFHLDAGIRHLDGETALKYARTRHGDSDYGRARRQQDIIRAVAKQVTNAGALPQLLSRAPQLLMTMQNSIQTDIPIQLGIELAQRLQEGANGDVQQLVLDNRYGEETFSSEGAWILLPDRARVRTALTAFFAAVDAPPGAQKIALADPAAVRIEILNGTSQPGAAARTAQLLQQRGWQVASIGDADRSDYVQTVVINYGVADSVAAMVSSQLNLEAEQAQINGLAASGPIDIRIVIGRDVLALIQ